PLRRRAGLVRALRPVGPLGPRGGRRLLCFGLRGQLGQHPSDSGSGLANRDVGIEAALHAIRSFAPAIGTHRTSAISASTSSAPFIDGAYAEIGMPALDA